MPRIKDYLNLFRVKQFYKNLVIFIALIFTIPSITLSNVISALLGFIVLCFITASYYIINDIHDIEKDKNHPEKKNRPIALGKISINFALLISSILAFLGLFFSFLLSPPFFYSMLALFLLSNLYTFYLREIKILDVITISVNFVIRAIGGIFVIGAALSPWIILSTFFLSIFLVSMKRIAELSILSSNKYRNYSNVSQKSLYAIAIFAITCVFVFFCVYSILYSKIFLLFSLPISIYLVYLFMGFLNNSPEKVRNPENFVLDKKVIISLIIWGLLIILALFLNSIYK